MADNSAAIARLQREYGNQLDKDVLSAILEVCGGNVQEAINFLRAQGNEPAYDARTLAQNETGIPSDYPKGSTTNVQSRVFTNVKGENKISEAERIKGLFLNDNISLQDHYDALKNSYDMYASVLIVLLHQGVEISKASRPRILAAAWARKENTLADYLLTKEDIFGLPSVLGAVHLLDAPRQIRAIEKKVARLEKQGTVKAKKLGQLKSTINDLKRESHVGSLSGALAKRIRKWVNNVSVENLEFYALSLPKEPWKELADIVHLNPSDFKCKWFLEYVYGKEAPSDSVIAIAADLTPETLTDVIKSHSIPYSFLRVNVKPIPEEAKVIIAKYSQLDTIIWYYEELSNKEVDEVISARLDNNEFPKFGYGKLMERLLYFKSVNAPFFKKLMPVAEKKLQQYHLQLESPAVVIGDASYSMDIAIRTATVIASVLTALCGADLKFFNGEPVNPPFIPRNIAQVLDIATGVKADGLTAAAAGLWPYYEKKKVVKFFLVVTDEIDNEKYKNYYFPTLFEKYRKEIYPAKIVFVSFLENPSDKGRMVRALENMGIVPLQFKLDGRRPDLTKLDSLLGLLASESSYFPEQVESVAKIIKNESLDAAIKKLLEPRVLTTTTSSKEEEIEEPEHNKNTEEKILEAVKKQPKEERESGNYCVICEERQVNAALVDCGHMSFCEECAKPLSDCPICRKKVIKYIRIYQT